MLSSPTVNGQTNFPFLHQTRTKMTTTLCHAHFRLFLARRPSLRVPVQPNSQSPAPHTTCNRALPFLVPAPHAARPPPSPVRLWFSTFCSILPLAACTFLCSPTSPQFQQLSRETSSVPLMAAPAAPRQPQPSSPIPSFPSARAPSFLKNCILQVNHVISC